MRTGRPNGSITPAWRSKPAVLVSAYRLYMAINQEEGSKSECARTMGLSRTTVIKWWDTITWTEQDMLYLDLAHKKHVWDFCDEDKIEMFAREHNLPLDYVELLLRSWRAMFPQFYL